MYHRRTVLIIVSGLLCLAAGRPGHAGAFDEQSAWLPEVEQLLGADRYPSRAAASRFLARDLAAKLPLQSSEASPAVVIRSHNELAEQLADDLRLLGMTTESTSSSPNASLVPISVDMQPVSEHEHQLTVTAQLPDGEYLRQVVVEDKPWVEADYREGDAVELVCVRGLTEESDALGSSRGVDVKAIEEVFLPRTTQLVGERLISTGWARRTATRSLLRQIEDSTIVRDRFAQTFYRDVDDMRHVALQREAILVDVSDQTIAKLARAASLDVRRTSKRRTFAVTFGIAITLISFMMGAVAYILFNRVTQGYYIWTIRFATAAFVTASFLIASRVTLSILNSL